MRRLPERGALMILSCRGKKGLLATRFMLSKVKLKGLSRRALGGLKKGILKWSMAGGDRTMFVYPLSMLVFWLRLFCSRGLLEFLQPEE